MKSLMTVFIFLLSLTVVSGDSISISVTVDLGILEFEVCYEIDLGRRSIGNGHQQLEKIPDMKMFFRYKDGRPDDVVLLWYEKQMQKEGQNYTAADKCLFSGHLLNEPDEHVAVVGCPSEGFFEIMYAGYKLNETMIEVVNSTAYGLRPHEENQPIDVDNEPDNYANNVVPAHPKLQAAYAKKKPERIIFDISLNYDREFHDSFGNLSSSQLRKVITLVKPVFLSPSLNTKFILNFVGDIGFYNHSLNAEKDIAKAKEYAETHPTNAHAYIVISEFNGNATGMAATIGSACSKDRGSRAAIVEWYRNELYTSRTLARELAHLFGIWPDFIMNKNTSSLVRRDHVHRNCTNQGGFMDYNGEKRNKWTTCSNEDFSRYYNHVVETYGSFCAPDCDEDDGPYCGF